ncbi:MBL fold metallo-hydrolase [Aquimarina agarilytica]|uniref:MBL fold metallo-hydrolase n=1 Tax=Aquimarina agarilytica TaxID=1087449 RepID=UPI00028825C5|nr:MBL fold metallo-hydrolase [Aquimarina agarilytica]
MKKLGKILWLSIIATLAIVSCKKDDETTASNDNKALFAKVEEALGGKANLSSALTITYKSTGEAFEFQEDPEPVNGKVADFDYSLIYNLNGTQSKQSWNVNADYAFATDFSFVETIDHTKGKSEGTTGTFSANFSGFGVTGDPMFSTKLAARQKTLLMSSPIAITKMIAKGAIQSTKAGIINVNFNTSPLGFGSDTPDIQLVIDTDTNLPIKSQVLENDPLLGDVVYEVVYEKWETSNDLKYPTRLTHILDGNIIRKESISEVKINPEIENTELTLTNEEAFSYNANEAKFGHLSSQFHFRTLLQTFPIDFPVEIVTQSSPLALASELVANDNNVYRVSGDFQSHYTYAFKIDGGLLLYDSPINDRRSKVVLDKIRQDFSTDPITYVVHSHNHFDHTGGLRGSLAEGGDLIVGQGSKSFIENVLQRPSTVLPNPIANTPINVTGVTDVMTIGTGDEKVALYTISTLHAEEDDYIVLYKPATKTIYFNDLYNPGFINVFDTFKTEDQQRMIALAKDIVNFVDDKNLAVTTFHCSHGFTTLDFDFKTIRDISQK